MTISTKFYANNSTSKIVANCSINIDNKIVITGFKVCDGKNGLFLSFPSVKTGTGDYKDTCYCLTKEYRKALNDKVIDDYKRWLSDNTI